MPYLFVHIMKGINHCFRNSLRSFASVNNVYNVELANLPQSIAGLELSTPVVRLDVSQTHLPF